jgi:hypothetical protein
MRLVVNRGEASAARAISVLSVFSVALVFDNRRAS